MLGTRRGWGVKRLSPSSAPSPSNKSRFEDSSESYTSEAAEQEPKPARRERQEEGEVCRRSWRQARTRNSQTKNGMRIRDARKDVQRKPGESRSQWKSRVLTHKLNIDAKK